MLPSKGPPFHRRIHSVRMMAQRLSSPDQNTKIPPSISQLPKSSPSDFYPTRSNEFAAQLLVEPADRVRFEHPDQERIDVISEKFPCAYAHQLPADALSLILRQHIDRVDLPQYTSSPVRSGPAAAKPTICA